MMRYALICDAGHEFDGWFRDSNAFEAQAARGLLSCAQCGSVRVEKAIMAPSVARRDREIALAPVSTPATPAAAPAQPMALIDPETSELRAAIKALRAHVEANAQNVGTAFAETARDMHEGVVEHKPIYGVATPEEVSALHEDGITALPLPILPDERN
ncbi:MAG: DUF1178 family protein [Bosea sp. (in: a-proteobacteria)]